MSGAILDATRAEVGALERLHTGSNAVPASEVEAKRLAYARYLQQLAHLRDSLVTLDVQIEVAQENQRLMPDVIYQRMVKRDKQ